LSEGSLRKKQQKKSGMKVQDSNELKQLEKEMEIVALKILAVESRKN